MTPSTIRIIVVDDDPEICELIKEYLERLGDITVDVAPSVNEARAVMKKIRYDTIVSDYQMPIENGIEFLKTLRAEEDTIPFIQFTGKGREEVAIDALNNGADDFIQKGGDARSQFTELEHQVKEVVRRDKVEHSLRENEQRLMATQDIGKTGSWELSLDESGGHIWGSEEGFRIFGIHRPYDGVVSRSLIERCIQDRDRAHQALQNLIEKGSDYNLEYEIVPADGGPHRIIHSEAKLILDENRRPSKDVGTIHDVTELQESDQRIRRLNRELVAIKECNHALVKARTEEELLIDVCRIVCEVAGYRMAWIGMADHDEVRSIRPVAFSGSDNSYVSQIKATWGDDVRGLGPAGMSIKTGRTVFIQDFEKDPRTGPWKELAYKNGYRSSIAIPLKDSEIPFGTFLLYSDQVNGFSAEELDLLEEMARDLAYGVIGLRVRKEQEIAEMTLKESEERFRTLSENTFEGIVIIIDDILIDVNDSMAHTLGYRTEEMIGRSFTDFVTPESIELLRKHQELKSPGPYEAQAITRHGDVLTVQIRGKDIIWKGRQARLKSIRDMTEQKRMVSALHESEERYRSLYFDSRDAIMILSPERGFLSGNPATCRLFGCQDDDDFISHSPSSFSPEHQPDGSVSSEKSQQMMGLALANGKQFFEWTHRRADGADFPATVLLSRLENSNEPLLQATVRDITLLKQAEEECRQNEETMRLVVASAPFPLLITNWDGTYILDANSQALEAFGLEIGQGQQLADLFEEETELETVMNDLASQVSVDGMEVTLRGKGGEPRWHVLSARTISYPGEERLLLATHDITERRMMGKALNDVNQKLGILNRITRHDMLNQMTVLKGFLELIEVKEKDPKILLYLEKISWAANNLEKQIAFTKDYQEIGVKAPGWVSFGNKFAEAFAMLHPDGVTIEDSSGGVEILADQLAEKIPYNLIDNSMRHGEHITQIKVMAEQVGGAMHIIYQDDGVGISEKDREHIFEKGFGKNTGLGLFISREILAITGISIEETGQGGNGVRFEISVPAGAWRIPSLLIRKG